MSAAVLRAQLLGLRRALALVVDRLQLVVEDRVDRRLRAHHRDRGARQRDAAVRVERRAGHRVEPRAVGLAHDHRDLRHGRFADRADHLRAVADDAFALDLRADHEARHVGEEQQRDVERVARLDEARGLVGRVAEQHAALVLGLVRDDPDRVPVQARVADDELLRPARVDLQQRVLVDERRDQRLHVERLVLVRGDQARRSASSTRARPSSPAAGRPASWSAYTPNTAWQVRSRPRRSSRADARNRRRPCASARRPSPRASPARRSPSPPSAASRDTSTRCPRA